MIIKSPRRYQCLTFNPNSEICYYDPRECIGQINDDHIIVYCNVELNSKLPGTNPIVKLYSLIQINHYKIYGTIFPGGNELCLKQDGNFINPYFVGDELLIKIKVIYKNLDLRLINLSTEFFRKKTKIFYGESTLQLVLSKNEL